MSYSSSEVEEEEEYTQSPNTSSITIRSLSSSPDLLSNTSFSSSLSDHHHNNHYHHHHHQQQPPRAMEDIWKDMSLASLYHFQSHSSNQIKPTDILNLDGKNFQDFLSKPTNITAHHHQIPSNSTTSIFMGSVLNTSSSYSSPTQSHQTTALSLNSGPDQFQPINSTLKRTTTSLNTRPKNQNPLSNVIISTNPFERSGHSSSEIGFPSSGESCTTTTKAERVNKRMIKNRESAARSRARKQAYTATLEKKNAELEEMNRIISADLEKLKKQLESFQAQQEPIKHRPLERTLTL